MPEDDVDGPSTSIAILWKKKYILEIKFPHYKEGEEEGGAPFLG